VLGALTSNNLSASAGILSTQLASPNSITDAQIANTTLTQAKKAIRTVGAAGADPGAGGVALGNVMNATSNSTSVVNGGDTYLTTLGNPVQISLQSAAADVYAAFFQIYNNGTGAYPYASGEIYLIRDSTVITTWQWNANPTGTNHYVFGTFPLGQTYTDMSCPAGAHHYYLQLQTTYSPGGLTSTINGGQLVAYEI
jgi:hypothetical protein